jgi:hypothetical protein
VLLLALPVVDDTRAGTDNEGVGALGGGVGDLTAREDDDVRAPAHTLCHTNEIQHAQARTDRSLLSTWCEWLRLCITATSSSSRRCARYA